MFRLWVIKLQDQKYEERGNLLLFNVPIKPHPNTTGSDLFHNFPWSFLNSSEFKGSNIHLHTQGGHMMRLKRLDWSYINEASCKKVFYILIYSFLTFLLVSTWWMPPVHEELHVPNYLIIRMFDAPKWLYKAPGSTPFLSFIRKNIIQY